MNIFKKEQEVTQLAMDYLDVVESCVEDAEAAVAAHLEGDRRKTEELHPRVSDLESKADDVRRDIEDKLFSGAYLPLMRGDIRSIMEALDTVPNAAEACARFFCGEKPEIPEEFCESFLRVAQESFGIMNELGVATRSFFDPKGKIDSIREHVRAVGVQESVVDGLEWDLTVAIFDSPSLDLAQKMHMKNALGRIARIPDRAEDAAEALVLVAMKSVL